SDRGSVTRRVSTRVMTMGSGARRVSIASIGLASGAGSGGGALLPQAERRDTKRHNGRDSHGVRRRIRKLAGRGSGLSGSLGGSVGPLSGSGRRIRLKVLSGDGGGQGVAVATVATVATVTTVAAVAWAIVAFPQSPGRASRSRCQHDPAFPQPRRAPLATANRGPSKAAGDSLAPRVTRAQYRGSVETPSHLASRSLPRCSQQWILPHAGSG